MKTILAVVGGALALFLTIAMFGGAGWRLGRQGVGRV